MPFRTSYIQIDGSLNIDGSIFQWQVPFTGGSVDISTLLIEQYVNSSSYYDGSLMYRIMPNPSTGLGNTDSQGMYVRFTAIESIFTGYCVRIYTSNPYVGLADADASNLMPAVMLYPASGGGLSTGQAGNFLMYGVIRYTSWAWTVGKQLYVSNTAGSLTTTAPTGSADIVQVLGISQSPDAVLFRPSPNFIQLK
jgi:hypothetical protein